MTNEILRVENLKKSFGKLEVLKGATTAIRQGEVVSVIGPSGGGKSTFLRCLNLLEQPTEGRIYFKGQDITQKNLDICQYRRKIGMVFQSFNVFPHMSVLENITLAPILEKKIPKAQATEEAMALLGRVGLTDKADEYPRKLSGGQKQRLSIVRALAMRPEVMLFDEPTSALDPEMVDEVLGAAWTTFAPVSKNCPALAKLTPMYSLRAPSPFKMLLGYSMVMWEPKVPEIHSMAPSFSTSARLELRLSIFLDQFSMVE